VRFYNSLFTEQFIWRPNLDDLSFDSIGEEEVIWLEKTFEECEVFEVMKALNSDKAPGPNGFTMAFFQACWDVLKEDIMNVFHDFRSRGMFKRSHKATFIALIPKKSRVVDMKDF
jgi:hypothetical protein